MENIPKHDSEQEREGYCSKDSWVQFFVEWDSIGVNYLLEWHHEVVTLNQCRPNVHLFIKFLNQSYLRTSIYVLSCPDLLNLDQ